MKEFGFVFIKPDDNTGEIIDYVRLQIWKLNKSVIINEREIVVSEDVMGNHYDRNKSWCEHFGRARMEFEISNGGTNKNPAMLTEEILLSVIKNVAGRIYIFVVFGEDINKRLQEIAGDIDPALALPGTIRYLSGDSFKRAVQEMRPVRDMIYVSRDEKDALLDIRNLCPDLGWMCIDECSVCEYRKEALRTGALNCE